jgi:putative membrane protein
MFLPILHAGTYDGPLLLAWHFNPVVTISLVVAAVGYYWALRRVREDGRFEHPNWQVACYYVGLLTVAVALLGPFDVFSDDVFTLHMIQHLILVQASAPLLLFGRPLHLVLHAISPKSSGPLLRSILRPRWVRGTLTALSNPVIAFVLFNGALVVWHVPVFFNAAIVSEPVHILEHVAFFGTALVYWWAMIDPIPRHHKMKLTWATVSVFFSMLISGSGIGAALTLADTVLYTPYLQASNPFGWTAAVDQQIGGLVMWVAGGTIWLFVALGILIRLLSNEDRRAREQTEAWEAAMEGEQQNWDEDSRSVTDPA